MTFQEWNNQSYLTFDDWFIKEWNDGWLRSDIVVSQFLIDNVQEEFCQILEKTKTKCLIQSIFKIKDRYFELLWSSPIESSKENLEIYPIKEVRKMNKDINIEYYEYI